MHVVMTFPAAMAQRGSDWATAARRGGAEVTEIVLVDSLQSAPLPAHSWAAQTASDCYHVEIPSKRKERKRTKRLAQRVLQVIELASSNGPIDVLHTFSAASSGFAPVVTQELDISHFHVEPDGPLPSHHAAVFENADAIRIWESNDAGAHAPDAYRERLRAVPTPIDFSLDGAVPQLTAIDADGVATAPGRPWLAAISPRRIVWRGNLSSPAALAMVESFAELRLTGTQLEMVGPDADRSDIEEVAERLGLEGRITIHAAGTPRQVAERISHADLLIVGDGDPLLEREVMTSLVVGTPVVVPPGPVYNELVSDTVGVVADPGDRTEFRRAIRRTTMVDVHDPVAMTARAARHTLASVGAELTGIYHELMYGEPRADHPQPLEVHDGGQLAS